VNRREIPDCRRKGKRGAREDKLRELPSDDLESEPLRDRYRRLGVVRLLGWLGRLRGRHPALLEHPLEPARGDDYECTGAFGLDLKACGTPRGPHTQVPGPATNSSSAWGKRIWPSRTYRASSSRLCT
jgi:hypothetical protein